jgi:hypothetical protein
MKYKTVQIRFTETMEEYNKRIKAYHIKVNKELEKKNGYRVVDTTGRKWFKIDYLSNLMRKTCSFRMIGQNFYYSPYRVA